MNEDKFVGMFDIRLQAKNRLLLVLMLATALAIIYELGSFVPLGTTAFGLFGLSDHLFWILQVIPYCVLLAVGFLVSLVYVRAYFRSRGNRPVELSLPQEWGWFLAATAIGIFALACGYFARSFALATIGLFSLAMAFIPSRKNVQQVLMIAMGLLVIAMAFALGMDGARRSLSLGTPAQFQFSDGDTKHLLLVRSGDRLLLLFDRDKQQFLLVKLDQLKSITWDRLPLGAFRLVGP